MNCAESISAVTIPTAADIKSDPGRMLRAKDAMKFLGMSRPTFYRYIKRGVVPKQRYMGTTPYWRLGDLQRIYDNLADVPADTALNSSK